eukprot:Tbor_TRINITY_DN4876_c0_g1::TRINITY_DN4876_c0_g1_i2::g.1272::m.1272
MDKRNMCTCAIGIVHESDIMANRTTINIYRKKHRVLNADRVLSEAVVKDFLSLEEKVRTLTNYINFQKKELKENLLQIVKVNNDISFKLKKRKKVAALTTTLCKRKSEAAANKRQIQAFEEEMQVLNSEYQFLMDKVDEEDVNKGSENMIETSIFGKITDWISTKEMITIFTSWVVANLHDKKTELLDEGFGTILRINLSDYTVGYLQNDYKKVEGRPSAALVTPSYPSTTESTEKRKGYFKDENGATIDAAKVDNVQYINEKPNNCPSIKITAPEIEGLIPRISSHTCVCSTDMKNLSLRNDIEAMESAAEATHAEIDTLRAQITVEQRARAAAEKRTEDLEAKLASLRNDIEAMICASEAAEIEIDALKAEIVVFEAESVHLTGPCGQPFTVLEQTSDDPFIESMLSAADDALRAQITARRDMADEDYETVVLELNASGQNCQNEEVEAPNQDTMYTCDDTDSMCELQNVNWTDQQLLLSASKATDGMKATEALEAEIVVLKAELVREKELRDASERESIFYTENACDAADTKVDFLEAEIVVLKAELVREKELRDASERESIFYTENACGAADTKADSLEAEIVVLKADLRREQQSVRASLMECSEVCFEAFNTQELKPTLCRHCGNTICLKCYLKLNNNTCCFCRKNTGPPISNVAFVKLLVRNYSVPLSG